MTTLTLERPTTPPATVVRTTALRYGLSETDLDALGRELDAIRERVVADLGEDDVTYLRRVIRWQRGLAAAGRASLFLGFLPPFWIGGAAALGLSKILDNMEIGHNVMHGQYDWTRDPALASSTFEWDAACPADQWRHSHNYLHHTFTNIHGKDRDIGYGVLRISPDQPWNPIYLANPIFATALALGFDYGVMLHDVEIDRIMAGKRTWTQAWPTLRDGLRKSGKQGLKDYVLWPALTGPLFLSTLLANAAANTIRSVWAFTIIFCGHFPTGVHEFTEAECEDESRGHWYFRQMLGSANITGGRLFHVLSGNLSHQIEHHLFPDLPAHRYPQIAPQVRAVCERFGLPYNSHRLSRQFGTVVGKILRHALPSGPTTAERVAAA
jgi:fatty acid desaturase